MSCRDRFSDPGGADKAPATLGHGLRVMKRKLSGAEAMGWRIRSCDPAAA
jgi:hypothetical protein